MTYELAKQLKDAGYPEPQIRSESHIYLTKSLMSDGSIQDIPFGAYELDTLDRKYPFAYAPTLTELIEACGEDFNFLCRNKDTGLWGAETHSGIVRTKDDSSEEAVALLYLKLHENKETKIN